ncbi:P2X purinoceptor 7-like [Strongylocentrotus purpuratus]|uniref:P2X purinoreceptor 7 intracellular domain-containing protein n=1 Tax=Strongylocentrotus purpuratus TaxID=7668 RepID=A0A7M7PKB9_STRPU|nr:P2X purinoceptor 7-like [Strongylocentrotus purpuratus]
MAVAGKAVKMTVSVVVVTVRTVLAAAVIPTAMQVMQTPENTGVSSSGSMSLYLDRGEPGQNVGDAGRANNANRLHENVEDWCTCGRCRVPPSFNEGDCVCCQEIAEVKAEADRQGSSCLVDSEEFEPAILNATTLYIGWMEYTDRWRRAAKAFGDRNNEKYRYVAYRKVVRWCWGWLGKDIRVQLPACVHASIMEAYPDGRGQYKGTILRRLR